MVGGLDPTGQAGLARDVAACVDLRVRPCPVASGIVVQTSDAVSSVEPVAAEALAAQIDAAVAEWAPRWAKVGALFSAAQVRAVADAATRHDLRLIVDPVLASSSGHAFLDDEGVAALRDTLLPRASLCTPNQDEWERLGRPYPALVTRGSEGVSLHAGDGTVQGWPATPLPGRHRGTGCRLATRIGCLLALDVPPDEAVAGAHEALQQELALDAAEQDMDPARAAMMREAERWFPRILAAIRHEDVPEVGMNLAWALPGATDPRRDVVGLAGRITIAGFGKAVTGRLAWGGPHHTGRIAVVLQEVAPEARLVLNHRYDPSYLEHAADAGLAASSFSRADEPGDVPHTMEWGVRHAIDRHRAATGDGLGWPDLVWDTGGVGKEAMVRVLARDPEDLVRKLRALHGERPIPEATATAGMAR